MIQVKLTKYCSHGKRGDVVFVGGNIAHGIIERGEGKIYKPPRVYKNRMMGTKVTKTKRTYRKRKK